MATLFGTDFTADMGDAFAGELLPITLHKRTTTRTASGATEATFQDHGGEGVRTKWREDQNIARGWPLKTARYLILQASLAVAPSLGDELTYGDERLRVIETDQDAGGATWLVWAVRR